MTKKDLIVENEKLKNRIEKQDKLLKEAIETNMGWQINMASARMFIAAIMNFKGVKDIEIPREMLEDVHNNYDIVFEEVMQGDEKVSGARIILIEKPNETETL